MAECLINIMNRRDVTLSLHKGKTNMLKKSINSAEIYFESRKRGISAE